MNIDQVVKNLPKSGVCALCNVYYIGLKIHYRSCYRKNSASIQTAATQVSSISISNDLAEPFVLTNVYDSTRNKWKCEFCDKFYFKDLKKKPYANHLLKYHTQLKSQDNFFVKIVGDDYFDNDVSLNDLDELFDDDTVQLAVPSWVTSAKLAIRPGKFNYVLLNINSITGPSKFTGLVEMINELDLDMLVFQETKISADVSDLLFTFVNYSLIRRDRCSGAGGGIMIFLKNCHKVMSKYIEPSDSSFETIILTIKLKNSLVNFVINYNPHFEYANDQLAHIESKLLNINLKRPTFILGDFNQDLLSSKGDRLREMMLNFGFQTTLDSPTHYLKNTATLLDIVFFNDTKSVSSITVVPCPFSDHNFVFTSLDLDSTSLSKSYVESRILNDKTLNLIKSELSLIVSKSDIFSVAEVFDDVDDRWEAIKLLIIGVIDTFAPLKKIRLKQKDMLPWVDKEILKLIIIRDRLHDKAIKSDESRVSSEVWQRYRDARNTCKSKMRTKMNDYFRDKTTSFFKSSKKFWDFYKSVVKTKKSSSNSKITNIKLSDGTIINDSADIANKFNNFIGDLSLPTDISSDEAERLVNENFRVLKLDGTLRVSNSFSIVDTLASEVSDYISKLDSTSSAGISKIPVKVIKFCAEELSPMLAKFFNFCFKAKMLPREFKHAIVTPLFKGKGDAENFDNYRGISVLPPLAKVCERCIAARVVDYFESNGLFSSCQNGFRRNFSCETGLISFVDECKKNMIEKCVSLALFVDFKKAFDLINPKLLFLKLFHYGFSNDALSFFKDYFNNRYQVTKVDDSISALLELRIGVAQGSVLGPLLFLIFINDIVWVSKFFTVLFADDTTLVEKGNEINTLVASFKVKIVPLLNWIKFNQLTINWNKTKFMFISNCSFKDELPRFVNIFGHEVEVVKKFKLLGVMIDSCLNFNDYLIDIKKRVNKRLYSIKNIFYLSQNVKVQFFKTFILPHFDYCLSLLIYFNKKQIDSMTKFYNICLYRLLGFKLFDLAECEQLKLLSGVNLLPFKLRVCYRLNIFCYKVMNKLILNDFYSKLDFKDRRDYFRSRELVQVPDIRTVYGRASFGYFLPKFINNVLKEAFNLEFKLFKEHLINNLTIIFNNFCQTFYNFKNINY